MKTLKKMLFSILAGLCISDIVISMEVGTGMHNPCWLTGSCGSVDSAVIMPKKESSMTPAQHVASLQTEIANAHQQMHRLVDQIAQKDLNTRVTLLTNVLVHEQQSVASLQKELNKVMGHLDRRGGGQFPGCPLCG